LIDLHDRDGGAGTGERKLGRRVGSGKRVHAVEARSDVPKEAQRTRGPLGSLA
jgi:hypothetical protein